jgi:hypothetical protein
VTDLQDRLRLALADRYAVQRELGAGPLHDSGAADGFLFSVMPYAESASLHDRITREHKRPVDVTPDGRFIIVRSVETHRGADAPLILVEHWFEDLNVKAGR